MISSHNAGPEPPVKGKALARVEPGKGRIKQATAEKDATAAAEVKHILDSKMSYLANVTDRDPTAESNLAIFLARIESEADKEQILAIRQVTDENERKRLKKQLSCFSVSGSVRKGGRKKAADDGRFDFNGLLACDFDRKDFAQRTPEEVQGILKADPHSQAVFESPSGGMKAIIRIPICESVDDFARAFLAAEKHFREKYGLKLDPDTKDPVRLTYCSWDPNLWLRSTPAAVLPVSPPEKLESARKSTPGKNSSPVKKTKSLSERDWSEDEVREMLTFIPPHPDYDEWLRISSAVWNERGERGTSLLMEWSPEQSVTEYEEKFKDRLSEVRIGTLIRMAQGGGYKIPSRSASKCVTVDFSPHASENEGFPTTRASDISEVTEALDFVLGLLILCAMSVVYGPSNCGKSFWCLYLAACVAMGLPFFGRDVEQGAVIYFGLEGSVGIQNRIMAMKKLEMLSDDAPLHLCFSPLSLLDPGHAGYVAETVARVEREEGCKVMLLVIDTYARAMAGGDENSGQDTSAVIATVDAIRSKSNAHVMLIHHSGKDEARGARGHSSLRAATDTEIEITRPEGSSESVVSVKKQRDIQVAESMFFKLIQVTLGTDRRGKPITSCVVQHVEGCGAPAIKRGRPVTVTEAQLLALLPKGSTTAWKMTAKSELGVKDTAFFSALKKIRESGLAVSAADGSWKVKNQLQNLFPEA